jgi:hypothetical protein
MHYPKARAWWWRFAWWRVQRCAMCGMPWTCDEAVKDRNRARLAAIRNDRTGAWGVTRDWPAQAYEQVGRAGNMTPAQLRRSQGRPAA